MSNDNKSEKSQDSSKKVEYTTLAKVIIICVAVLFWPFALGYLLCRLIYRKVDNKPLKWGLIVPIALFAMAIGLNWVTGWGTPSAYNSQTTEQQANTKIEEKKDIVETKEVAETQPVAFESRTVEDGGLAKGQTVLDSAGQEGEKTLLFAVVYRNGQQVEKKLIKETVTKAPIANVVRNGTYVAPPPQAPVTPAASSQSTGGVRVGAICRDGWRSSATGRGACSHHGGVAQWLYN